VHSNGSDTAGKDRGNPEAVINAPSAINLQPWEFYVVMGEEKARSADAL
jgi:nitroreductase